MYDFKIRGHSLIQSALQHVNRTLVELCRTSPNGVRQFEVGYASGLDLEIEKHHYIAATLLHGIKDRGQAIVTGTPPIWKSTIKSVESSSAENRFIIHSTGKMLVHEMMLHILYTVAVKGPFPGVGKGYFSEVERETGLFIRTSRSKQEGYVCWLLMQKLIKDGKLKADKKSLEIVEVA